MMAQWLNRNRRRPVRPPLIRFKHRLQGTTPVQDQQTGFIHHPWGFPLALRRLWLEGWRRVRARAGGSDIGLIFDSEKYLPPGAMVEVTIPLRGELERFHGRVVLVRHVGGNYEIGLSFPRPGDASRMRIVEQVCHIEAYLQQKKYSDGPYVLNRERLAAEWIDKYAGTVPGL